MTYLLMSVPFIAVTAIAVVVAARRPGAKRRLMASTIAATALIALTIVFDNVMIAAGLFTYPDELISGIRIGLAPVEDLLYPVCIAFLLPAIGAFFPRKEAS